MRLMMMLVLGVLVAGCSVRPPIGAQRDPYLPEQVHMTQRSLRQATAVQDPIVTRDEGGILHATVPIRSETGQQLHVDYRVTFFDHNRRVLSQSGWFTKVLPPRTPDQITVNSMGPGAHDFQVDFRWAR